MNNIIVKVKDESIVIRNVQKNNLKIKDEIIIQSKNGLLCGTIEKFINKTIKKNSEYDFVRKCSEKDKKQMQKNHIDSQKAFIKCRELIKKYKLPMKLINATYSFDREQLLFNFVAEDRVDFRKLARDLANIYKTRIELRQIGVRDKAKEIGGCGQCGRALCCKGFLKSFNSVSINMAKNQNIALNPSKINGICGRLLCCLKYEDEYYKECRKNLPKAGEFVKTKQGEGKVHNVNPIKQTFSIINNENLIIECDLNDRC